MANVTKKELLDLAVPLAKDVLPKLVNKVTSSVLDELERKISGQEEQEKWPTLFISDEDIDDIAKILESLEKSDLLMDGATGIVKYKIKNQKS